MKQYKFLLETKDYIEVKISLPFYAYCQVDGEEIFVKITYKEFKRITFYMNGGIEIFKCRTSNYIASVWYSNKTDWKHWQEAVRSAKNSLKSF